MKNKFFTREFVPAAQISQVERKARLMNEKIFGSDFGGDAECI